MEFFFSKRRKEQSVVSINSEYSFDVDLGDSVKVWVALSTIHTNKDFG
jgi:hypothetical protein